MISLVVSNCETASRREDAVAALAKLVDVRVIGLCASGNESVLSRIACPKGFPVGAEDCVRDLIRRSYFHLALENSVCRDYVTEKYRARH